MSGKHRNKRLSKKYPPGTFLRFGWNHVLGEPSSLMSIESMVMDEGGILVIPVPTMKGTGKIALTNLMDWIDWYGDEVEGIVVIPESRQVPLCFFEPA